MNEASESDIHLLEEWIAMDEKNEQYLNQIRNTWNSVEVEKELDDLAIQNDYYQIISRIEHKSFIKRYFLGNRLINIAAVFILGIASAWIFLEYTSLSPEAIKAINTIETPRGSRATIILPDSSIVLLNAESRLTYPQQFSSEGRSVFLEGEAFFEIEKDVSKPFLVKTPDITVKVFGTSFNVKSYPDENTTETTLVEGSISIIKNPTNGRESGTELKMEPNQRLVLYKEERKIIQANQTKRIENVPPIKAKSVLSKSVDTQQFTAWKDGRLKIDSEPMEKLVVTLERRYDVKVHFVDEEIKQIRYTGTFENETIEQVMAALKLASGVDYKIEERDIWISKLDR